MLFTIQQNHVLMKKDYLVTIPYEPKKSLSREFLSYFAETLNEVATED